MRVASRSSGWLSDNFSQASETATLQTRTSVRRKIIAISRRPSEPSRIAGVFNATTLQAKIAESARHQASVDPRASVQRCGQ